jgi:uncharacterized RDD family membrane protein YckC
MDTAKPRTPPTPRPTTRPAAPVRVAPMSSRTIAASLVVAFLIGGLIAGAVPMWAFILIGLVVGALAMYGMDRFGRSRG